MTRFATHAQVNLYADDPDALAAFYAGLGLAERFRYPATGPADHVELAVGGLTLGLTRRTALSSLAGLSALSGPPGGEVVLWGEDCGALYAQALALGAVAEAPPRDFQGRLRAAWVRDPQGHRVKLVSPLASGARA